MHLSFDHLQFRYEPFPIGIAKPAMSDALYADLVAQYPPLDLFAYFPKVGHKYSLSERFNNKHYQDFIQSHPAWREFHRWIKSESFVEEVMEALKARHIDLGYGRPMPKPLGKRVLKFVKRTVRGKILSRPKLTARFEFSMLPADGGCVIPHTDAPNKIVTLIVSMIAPGEWNPEFGGGTDVNRPKRDSLSFNQLNRQGEFEEMEVLGTYDFTPNQAVVFVKTFNSWHSVRPMTGAGSPSMRKTLTINIETPH